MRNCLVRSSLFIMWGVCGGRLSDCFSSSLELCWCVIIWSCGLLSVGVCCNILI